MYKYEIFFRKPFRGGYVKCRLKSDTHQTITLSRFVRHFFQSLPRRREHCAAAIHLITRSIYYKNNDVDVTMSQTSNQIISIYQLSLYRKDLYKIYIFVVYHNSCIIIRVELFVFHIHNWTFFLQQF